jgi:sortase A
LKDVVPGELIELTTGKERNDCLVYRIIMVDSSDVSVLKSGSTNEITLVTCYPFYFIGEGPYRYVIQASLHQHRPQADQVDASSTSETQKEKEI